MKKNYLFVTAFCAAFLAVSCSDSTRSEDENSETLKQQDEEIIVEEVEEEEPTVDLSERIQGTWAKIAQDCDPEGNNCDMTSGTDWIFDGENVSLGRIQQPYSISNDTLYIVDSPYEISKEWGDTILLHGIKVDRYTKLVKK